ncbi:MULTISPECIES: DivIVA domain-containing protein [Cryobacterium]|uniref:Cell wall synthesis protein Wag31 n=1 Tax=Cryobacterium levicorallinum TaxID=995038 RepID=A0A1I3BPN7_9MICO|nr:MULTISPECIES: DivIVA domain-containing protein [Cryobacterium]TFB83063.1 DivIVA domain-containing protein [Cryobacterium levicorallinum]TFD63837.1 DivIVA domain-containing protein [Cryobacterium sp. Hh38]GEP25463.1 cell wall synthesis protein Wag31 [Cryobacterium levicorallinum]SFH63889.1 DivIVA domain-containing protein [Cryobacterium levicorallinum]
MALTPEDVVNKRFQSTKFREGYDQDEVDDFLDEVVVELRRLTKENEELRGGAGSEAAPAVESAPVAAVVAEPVAVAAPVAAAAPIVPTPIDETAGTTNLLQLARRLHEEHVKEGAEKRDALIAEGHATAARVIAEAETQQRVQLQKLDLERTALEGKIDGLRTFEREYRLKLKSYIEGQLNDLDASSVDSPSSDSSSKPSFQGFGA